MNHHSRFWSFKTKDQRRFDNDLEKSKKELLVKDRSEDVSTHTHLDHIGRKGFLGLEHSMPAFFRHAKNLIFSRWIRAQAKPSTYDSPL